MPDVPDLTMPAMSHPQQPAILGRTPIATGKFLALETIQWSDSAGQKRLWENACRVSSKAGQQQAGAALMICWLWPSDRLLLVRQFRPPAGGMVLEFPAGLIDAGEQAETAAIRELLEETGYTGQINRIYPPAYNTPGLSSERTWTTLITIDETAPINQDVKPNFQDGEDIAVLRIERDQLRAFIDQELSAGTQLDSKVVAYLAALGI